MPLYTVRFGQKGRGQQLTNAPKGQRGMLSARNVTNTDGAVSKRPGANVVSLSRSDDPADLIADARAIASRGNDVVIVTDTELYSHQTCGLSGASTAGTATPTEISDALAALDVRASSTQVIDVALPGSATAGSARTRLDRVDVPTTPVVITPSGRTISTALSTDGTTITWTMTEGTDVVDGELTGSVQRLARIDAVVIPPQVNRETDAIRITWISQTGSIATLSTVTLVIDAVSPDLRVFPQFVVLTTMRGTAAGASYEVFGGAVAAFTSAGVLNVWEFEDLSSVQSYAVTSPPGLTGAYAVDVSAVSFPLLTTGLAVAWAGSADGIARAAQLKTDDSTVLSQMSYSGILTDSNIQIAIFDAPVVTWDLADSTGSQVSGTRMVWRFNPLDTAIRAIDLPGGADMRMSFSDTAPGGAQYDIRDATTANQLYPLREVQGISGVIDHQWGAQTDTIYGVLTSDTGGFFEVLWERTAEVSAVLVDSSVFSAAMAVSTNRLTATYWLADTQLRIIRRTTIASGAVTVAFIVGSGVGVTGNAIAAAVEFEDAASTVTMGSVTWRDDGQALSLYVREIGNEIFLERVDAFPEVPIFAAEIQGSPGIGPFRIIFSVRYASGSSEVYESTPTLFVRVSPALEVRAGGNWTARGPWTRTRLLSDVVRHHGTNNVLSADAATVLNEKGDPCTFVASEVTTSGGSSALFDVISTHTEAQGVLDATGKRPRVSPFDDRRLAVSFESSSRELITGTWSPGSAISFTSTGHTLLTERAWDQASFEANAESAVVLAAVDDFGGAASISFHVYPDISPALNFSAGTGVATIVDVGVSARALPDGVSVQLAWAVVGNTAPGVNNQLVAGVVEVNLSTLAVNFLFSRSVAFPGGTAVEPVAVSVDSRDGASVECWVELEGPINRHVEVHDVESATDSLLVSLKRCALVSQLSPVVGQVVGAISLLGTGITDPDTDDTFVGGQAFRDGVVLICARTLEVVGRVSVGSVEDFATRQLRYPKTGLNIGPDGRIDLGWQETDLDIGTTRAPTLVRYAWTPDSDAYEPAVLDAIMVGANGGYPRLYDGRTTHEHDWHELPEIVKISTAAGGTPLLAGNYNLAVTFESYDSTGKLYRSRPTFAGPITILAGDVINVFTRDLSLTERDDVRAVLWRTTEQTASNADPTYYRETEALATLSVGVDVTQTSLLLADTLLIAREPLDQGDLPGDVLPSDPIELTDFTATLDGRIWGIAPRQPNSAYYTVAKGEASGVSKGAHWSLAQIITHDGPGRLTAAVQMGSRIGILTALNGSGIYTPGPDATGAGSYQTPEPLHMAIGPRNQAVVAKIPEGIVFAPARRTPVQLLSNGWVAVDLGDEIADPFQTGDQVPASIAYIQSTNALHVLGEEPDTTHQLQFDSKTWETDSRRGGIDLTVRDNGQLVILSPSLGVLFEENDQYSSGGTGYITSVRTEWLLTDGRPEVSGNLIEVRVHGLHRGEHALTMRIREDYNEAVVAQVQVSQATIADHAANGVPYVYYYREGRSSTAISVEVLDDGPPNQSFAIEAIVVSTESSSTGGALVLRTRNLQKEHAFVTPQ